MQEKKSRITFSSDVVQTFETLLRDTLQGVVGFKTASANGYTFVLDLLAASIKNKNIEQYDIVDARLQTLAGNPETAMQLKPGLERLSQLSTYMSGNAPYFYQFYRSIVKIGSDSSQTALNTVYSLHKDVFEDVRQAIDKAKIQIKAHPDQLEQCQKKLSFEIASAVYKHFEPAKAPNTLPAISERHSFSDRISRRSHDISHSM